MTAIIAPFESESEAVRFQSEVSVMVIKIDHTPLTSSHSHNSRVTRSISRTHMTFFQQQAPEVLTEARSRNDRGKDDSQRSSVAERRFAAWWQWESIVQSSSKSP